MTRVNIATGRIFDYFGVNDYAIILEPHIDPYLNKE